MERPLRMLRRQALPLRLSGPIIEAALPEVAVGEICEIRRHWRSREVIAHAQVLGFHRERTVLSLIGAAHGLSREMLLHPTGGPLRVAVGDQLLGTVILPLGSLSELLAPDCAPSMRPRPTIASARGCGNLLSPVFAPSMGC